MFRSVGLAPSILAHPDTRIAYRKLLELLNTAAIATNRTDFGLLLSHRQGLQILGGIGYAMREAPNVRTAITNLCQYFHVHISGATTKLIEEDGLAIWSYSVTLPSPPDYRQQIDLILGIGLKLIRRLTNRQWTPNLIHIEFKKQQGRHLERLMKCPVIYDQECNALIFATHILDQKINTANDELYQIILSHLQHVSASISNDFITLTRNHIIDGLENGIFSIDDIAASMAMTRRVFQLNLKRRGYNYRTFLTEIRMDLAKRYLGNSGISLTQISDMLGYKEPSSFSHSFHRNIGVTPRQWRANPVDVE